MTTKISPAHTCVDRPHLPCDACNSNPQPSPLESAIKGFFASNSEMTEDHVKKMVTIAWRFGYRACLLDCVPHHSFVTAERIDERAKTFLGEDYVEV